MANTVEIYDIHHATTWVSGKDIYSNWCKQNCQDSWRIVKYRNDTITAGFVSEQDLMLFLLKFGGGASR